MINGLYSLFILCYIYTGKRVDIMDQIEVKIWEFLKGLGTILLYFVISMTVSSLLVDYYYHQNIIIATLVQILVYVILLLILGAIYHKRLWHDFKNFKKEYVGIAIKNWIIGLGAMLICNIIISSIAGGLATNEEANRNLIALYPVSSLITMVFIGPLVEEITFRASFKKAFSKWYTFAIVTSLLFGAAHIQSFFVNKDWLELLYLIPYSSLGFFFAKAFYETDNIFTSYLAHMIHNGMCVILIILLLVIG